MKKGTRIIIIIAAAILAVVLVVVGAMHITKRINATRTFTEFSAYLDNAGFVPPIDRTAFMELMSGYKYDGKSITELDDYVYFWDRNNETGVISSTKEMTLHNSSTTEETEGGKKVSTMNRLTVKRPLEGLEQPFGIPFGATLTEALEKMGIRADPEAILDLGQEKLGSITLYEIGETTLRLSRNDFTDNDPRGHVDWHFRLIYAEFAYDGDDMTVRTVAFNFDWDNLLYEYELGMREEYYLDD